MDLKNKGIVVLNQTQQLLNRKKTIAIIGVARSGTSMVGRVLNSLGVFMGTQINEPIFEDRQISKLLEKDESYERFANLVKRRNRNYDIWAWKRPSAVNYVDVFQDVVRYTFYHPIS